MADDLATRPAGAKAATILLIMIMMYKCMIDNNDNNDNMII